MNYLSLSNKIGTYLANELHYDDEKRMILAYAIENIILSIVGFLLIMLIGFILGVAKETFFAALAGGVLRKFSGGVHCSTAFRCLISGAVIYPIIGLLANLLFFYSQSYNLLIIVMGVISIFIVFRYAPVDSKAKPIISPTFKKKLRLTSIITVLLFCTISATTLTSSIGISTMGGLFFQSVTLLPVFSQKEVILK